MNKIFFILLLFGYSIHIYADIIDILPKNKKDMIELIDPSIEEVIEDAKYNQMTAAWLYFFGGDEYYYAGSLFLDKDELTLVYFLPEQEGFWGNDSCIMAYIINRNDIQLIIKKWMWGYAAENYEKEEKDIVYYHITLTEKDGKIEYTCAYTTPTLDLNEYTINAATVVDENIYAYSTPSFGSEKIIELKKGTSIEILPTRLAENGPETKPYDFWYKIEINKKEAWVYGYFINFSNKVKIK
ncbi:MAG: SH3 domain-containing protein [Treponema sp.]|jgi:hypothetical protein|nr:SH3 domain-containing protein [Treponema sp.]